MANEERGDSAEEAFEKLRSEVALLRRAIEGMAAGAAEAAPPDYSPTLAGLRKAIDRVSARLEELIADPPVTKAQLTAGIAAAVGAGRTDGQRDLAQAKAALENGVRELVSATGAVRAARIDRRNVLLTGIACAILGTAVWIGVSGPLARALPDNWRVPERMAAATLDSPQWEAGARLMAAADQGAWMALVDAREVARANRLAFESCRKKASKLGRPVGCEVEVPPAEGNPHRPSNDRP